MALEAQSKPNLARDTHFGSLKTSLQPLGVSLILSTSQNPLRFAFSPLAASIAARNAAILATTRPDRLFELFQREVSKYMDTFIVQVTSARPSDVKAEDLDHILIIGAFLPYTCFLGPWTLAKYGSHQRRKMKYTITRS